MCRVLPKSNAKREKRRKEPRQDSPPVPAALTQSVRKELEENEFTDNRQKWPKRTRQKIQVCDARI